MKFVKKKILVLGLILAVMSGFAGIVEAAPPCGGNAVFDPQGIGSVGTSTIGTVVTYNVAAADTIIGLCVQETDRTNLTSGLSDPQSPDFWTFQHQNDKPRFSFEREGQQLRLFATQNADIGQADFGSDPLPTAEKYALHVENASLCTSLSGTRTESCWIAPGSGTPPVPELNPTVLTVTGLFGLVLLSRKYKP
jgi:hypothetical protein